jgi:phosphoribosyl-AMP cyclohydrolase
VDASFIDELTYNDQGLIPAIVQDHETGEVLMMAWMNKDSIRQTLEKGLTSFWSRSRQKYWVKGESSGHTQEVKEIRTDCDKDVLLIRAKQNGAACHLGYYSCFFRKLQEDGTLADEGEKVFDPDEVYKKK